MDFSWKYQDINYFHGNKEVGPKKSREISSRYRNRQYEQRESEMIRIRILSRSRMNAQVYTYRFSEGVPHSDGISLKTWSMGVGREKRSSSRFSLFYLLRILTVQMRCHLFEDDYRCSHQGSSSPEKCSNSQARNQG